MLKFKNFNMKKKFKERQITILNIKNEKLINKSFHNNKKRRE